jgi:hypothetical protein
MNVYIFFTSNFPFFIVRGKVCVFGGIYWKTVTSIVQEPSISPMAILDPTTLVWSEPKLKNPNIPKLVAHSATAVNNYMLVAFGKLFTSYSIFFLKKKHTIYY